MAGARGPANPPVVDTPPGHEQPLLVWVCDSWGHCSGVNDAWLRWRGGSRWDEAGREWLDVVHPDDAAAALSAGYGDRVAARKPFTMEVRVRRIGGGYGRLLAAGTPICRGDGAPDGYVVTCLDVSRVPATRRWWTNADDLLQAVTAEIDHGLTSHKEACLHPSEPESTGERPDPHLTLVGTARGAAMHHLAHYIEATELAAAPPQVRAGARQPARSGTDVALVLLGIDAEPSDDGPTGEWHAEEAMRIALTRAARTVRQGDVAVPVGRGLLEVILNRVTGVEAAVVVATTIQAAISRPMWLFGREVTPRVRVAVTLLDADETMSQGLRRAQSLLANRRDSADPRAGLVTQAS